jgi:hypothetical protein
VAPQQQQRHEAERGRGGIARAGPALSVAPPASSASAASVFTVPPGLSPSGLLDSPGLLFSPAMVRRARSVAPFLTAKSYFVFFGATSRKIGFGILLLLLGYWLV